MEHDRRRGGDRSLRIGLTDRIAGCPRSCVASSRRPGMIHPGANSISNVSLGVWYRTQKQRRPRASFMRSLIAHEWETSTSMTIILSGRDGPYSEACEPYATSGSGMQRKQRRPIRAASSLTFNLNSTQSPLPSHSPSPASASQTCPASVRSQSRRIRPRSSW